MDEASVLRQHGFHRVPVTQVVRETADTSSFVLDVPEDLRETFGYRAGQFCTVRVRIDGNEHLRSYSMSSAPESGDPMTLTVKRVPGGLVSNWLIDHVGAGDVLELTRPAGKFCLRPSARPIVAFCGGSGVTPVISIARSAVAAGDRPVRILYANRDQQSVIFDEAFASLAGRHPDQLEVQHHLDGASGFLDSDAIRRFLGDDLDADTYICGPTPFMDLVETTLLDAGVSPDQILIERFGTPEPEPEPEPTRTVEVSRDLSARNLHSSGGADGPAAVTIILNGKKHEIAYQAGDTLLNTARRGGLSAPFSCEAGNCATCMAMLREGTATMRVNDALTDEEVAEGWVLTCQAVPTSPTLTVEYEQL